MQSKFHLVPTCFSLLNNTIRDIIKLMSLRADLCLLRCQVYSRVVPTPGQTPKQDQQRSQAGGKNPNLYKKFLASPPGEAKSMLKILE
jgi:hypothetical protein